MSNYYNRQWRLPNNENKDKQSNYSMDFDGTDDYLSFDLEISNNTVTYSFWAKSSKTGYQTIIDFSPSGGSGKGLSVSSGGFNVEANIGGNTTPTIYRDASVVRTAGSGKGTSEFLSDGNWHHYIISGLTFGSGFTSAIIGAAHSTPPILYYQGEFDGFAIFNYALSSSQVTTLYGSSSTGIGNPMAISGGGKPVAFYPLGDQDSFNGADYLVPNSSLKDYVFDFNGTSSYLDLGSTTFIDTSSSFTISGWYKSDGITASFDNTFAFKTNSTASFIGYYNNYGGYSPFCFGLAGNSTFRMDGGTIPSGWFHLSLVYDGNGIANTTSYTLYINNQSQSLTTAGGLSGPNNINHIGEYNSGNYFNGEISNVQTFNTALPATGSNSVETLYNNGSPLTSMSGFTSLQGWWKLDASATYDGSDWTIPDDSTNSNTGTSSGMTQANLVQSDLSFTSGYSPYALDFDGTNDYIDLGTYTQGTGLALNADMSISAWIKTSNLSSTQVVICNYTSGSSGGGYCIEMNRQGNGQYGILYNGATVGLQGSTILSSNTWYHIVMTRTGTSGNWSYNLYLNGNPDGSATNVAQNFGNGSVAIGRFGAYDGGYFNGSISNVSVWNAALTSSQVSEIYNEGVPSNLNNHSAYSNLVSWWQLGSNTSWVDPYWIALDEKGTNNGESQNVAAPNNMGENAIVDGVGSYANGLSSGMGGDEIIGDAPYSSSNSLSVNMDVLDRVEDTPS